MPRTRRLLPYSDAALHITARGNNHLHIFQTDPDKTYYLKALRELIKENNLDIFHYCLMDNHVHLITWLRHESKLSRFMKQLQLKYFNYYKTTYGYTGHLWQGRFKSNLIDTGSYLLQCGKYIEVNPVRAKIVTRPEDYSFSSYRYYAYGANDPLITPSPEYMGLSDNADARKKQYINYVVDNNIINSRRLKSQLFIGSTAFIKKSEKYYYISNTSLKLGRPKKIEK